MLSRALALALLVPGFAAAMTVTEEIEIAGNLLHLLIDPGDEGAIAELRSAGASENLAGGSGILQEGFGVASYYVPNRRMNERFELLREYENRPVIRYSYDCEGPNINGLRVERIIEPIPDEASVRVTWAIENRGNERQWLAPWVRNDVAPGGGVEVRNRMDLPALEGIVQPRASRYYRAARNWTAVTDPMERSTVYGVFHADHTHAFLAHWDLDAGLTGFQTAFTPRLLQPGDRWQTTYRVNVVRGLHHVSFASDELAAQIDYRPGELTVLISPVKSLPEMTLDARVVAPNGRVWRLPSKRFSVDPNRLARCTYEWEAPGPGPYEFLGQLRQDGEVFPLGKDTSSPHGGIDTQFVVGRPDDTPFEAWTDAPYMLQRGPRTLERHIAHEGAADIWFESPLEKVFKEDAVRAAGEPDPVHRIALARNERESFQLVIRPEEGPGLANLTVHFNDLVHEASGERIPASDISAHRVGYVQVNVPSYYEGPTGEWPDPLPPLTPFYAPGGESSAIWATVYARPGLPAGEYRGLIEIHSANGDPIELWLVARVYGFDLPMRPALKTDFGFSPQAAVDGAIARGGAGDRGKIFSAYLNNALANRVTLRELTHLPPESERYREDLAAFERRLRDMAERGASTFLVPASLLGYPELLRQANEFVRKNGLEGRAFTHLAGEPLPPFWPRLVSSIERWRELAPDIPVMVTTQGTMPFLHESLDIWNVHAQVMDTEYAQQILRRIINGGEVWWYFNYAPPRPYGNFFIDFAGTEHRILFWQSFALGVRGIHYWNVNYVPEDGDPWIEQLDLAPTNGDGFLLYPGPDGPINSIRWEIIRDGIEDYDYLAILQARLHEARRRGADPALLRRAEAALDLAEIAPNLVGFSRDPRVIERKRAEIAEAIEALSRDY